MDDHKLTDVVVIGAGPAGYTAAIYAARGGQNPVLVEGLQPGGQLMITNDIENYPGFGEPLPGPDLMAAMRVQAERVGTEIITDIAASVNLSSRPFKVEISNGVILAKTLVIATGAEAKWLGIESEERFKGRGVSACATCDGFFFREKVVAVVGAETPQQRSHSISPITRQRSI